MKKINERVKGWRRTPLPEGKKYVRNALLSNVLSRMLRTFDELPLFENGKIILLRPLNADQSQAKQPNCKQQNARNKYSPKTKNP